MSLFRSEEHIDRWLGDRQPGATIAVTTLSALAHAWWADRLSPQWRPHTRDQNQAILDDLGLTDPFWQLPAELGARGTLPVPAPYDWRTARVGQRLTTPDQAFGGSSPRSSEDRASVS